MSYDPITLFSIGICIGAPLSVLMVIISDKIRNVKQKKFQRERQERIQKGTYRYRGSSLYFPHSPTLLEPLDLKKLRNG